MSLFELVLLCWASGMPSRECFNECNNNRHRFTELPPEAELETGIIAIYESQDKKIYNWEVERNVG